MKTNHTDTKKPFRLIRWIPFLLLLLFIILLIVNAVLSDGARDTVTAIVNVCMYVFAGISFLLAVVSCVFDIGRMIREKNGKAVLPLLLNVLGIVLWAFLLYLNGSFTV